MSDCIVRATKSSFRGVEFDYDRSDKEGGRNIAVHDYAFREDHYTEDLGAMPGRFQISGYLSQPNVRDKASALYRALDARGPGIYYDAFFNSDHLVRVDGFNINASRADAGTVFFTAIFIERGSEPAPTAIRSALAGLNSALGAFNEALGAGYSLIFDTIDDAQSISAGFLGAGSFFEAAWRGVFGGSDAGYSVASAFTDGTAISGGPDAVGAAFDEVLSGLNYDQTMQFLGEMSSIEIDGSDIAQVAVVGAAIQRMGETVISQNYSESVCGVSDLRSFVAISREYADFVNQLGLCDLGSSVLCLSALAGQRVNEDDFPSLKNSSLNATPAIAASFEIYGNIDRACNLTDWNNGVSGSLIKGGIDYVIAN